MSPSIALKQIVWESFPMHLQIMLWVELADTS